MYTVTAKMSNNIRYSNLQPPEIPADIEYTPVGTLKRVVEEQGRGSGMIRDVLAYALARFLLAAALSAAIYGVARLFGVEDFPLYIAIAFAIVIALPLGMWVFTPLRRRAAASVEAFDARRRHDREQLQARLRGEDPTD